MWVSMPNYIGDTFRESKITLEIFFFFYLSLCGLAMLLRPKLLLFLKLSKENVHKKASVEKGVEPNL